MQAFNGNTYNEINEMTMTLEGNKRANLAAPWPGAGQ